MTAEEDNIARLRAEKAELLKEQQAADADAEAARKAHLKASRAAGREWAGSASPSFKVLHGFVNGYEFRDAHGVISTSEIGSHQMFRPDLAEIPFGKHNRAAFQAGAKEILDKVNGDKPAPRPDEAAVRVLEVFRK